MKIGAQMYTVREYTKTLADFSETLKKLADIGYQTVQVSGTCAYEAEWLRDELKKNGLTCVITHTPIEKMEADPAAHVRFHKTFGCDIIGLGCCGDIYTPEGYEAFCRRVRPIVDGFRKNGAIFSYHNHGREFIKRDGENSLERLMRDFTKEEMLFTFDVYWAQFAGADPAAWLETLAGRVPCIHFKDMLCNEKHEQRMAPVGWGNMNFPRILSSAEKAGVEYLLVEQDDSYGEDPFVCMKKSYDYLRAQGLE